MSAARHIIRKTMQVSSFTLLSRVFGIIREILMVRYLGATGLSDAFITAFKVPNSLRKIFAEGALSAAFVPTLVQTAREKGSQSISGLMTLGFLVFESLVGVLCVFGIIYAYQIIGFIAPGFSADQVERTAPLLQIVMSYIFFISSSALFAGALQAANQFFIPASSPILFNIIFIGALIICKALNLPATYLCWFILVAGAVQLLYHVYGYIRLQFGFSIPTVQDLKRFFGWSGVFVKFLWCLLSMSVMEIGLFVDTSFASYLPASSISLIYYANRFMGIPLGVFATAFSTILLPYFSRIVIYAPKRLSFFMLEAAKLMWWMLIPTAVTMAFLSKNIFISLFLSQKFTLTHAHEAGIILSTFLIGLFFFAYNKIIQNIFYALHVPWIPGVVGALSIGFNIILNALLMPLFNAPGLALATSLSAILQLIILLSILRLKYGYSLYIRPMADFIGRALMQLFCCGLPVAFIYFAVVSVITRYYFSCTHLLFESIFYWFWVGPLIVLFGVVLWITRTFFGIRLYFLDH